MGKEKVLFLIASVIFSLLTVGYAVVIAVDFYSGYTPEYLIILHIIAAVVFFGSGYCQF